MDAVFAAMSTACETLLAYDNVQLYAPLLDGELVLNLDNYCDYVHHSNEVCQRVLDKMTAGRTASRRKIGRRLSPTGRRLW